MMNTSVHHFPAYFDDVDAGRVIHCCMIHCIELHSNQNQSKLHPSAGHHKKRCYTHLFCVLHGLLIHDLSDTQ